jgi:hypothetical protein
LLPAATRPSPLSEYPKFPYMILPGRGYNHTPWEADIGLNEPGNGRREVRFRGK